MGLALRGAVFVVAIVLTTSASAMTDDDDAVEAWMKKLDAAEQQERKERSHRALSQHAVPIDAALPPVLPASQAQVRNASDVALRSACLAAAAATLAGDTGALAVVRAFDLESQCDATERAIFSGTTGAGTPADPSRTRQYEAAAHALLWSLGFVSELPVTPTALSAGEVLREVSGRSEREYYGVRDLRAVSDLLDALDAAYRVHWAAEKLKANVDRGAAFGRFAALDWLTGNDQPR